MDGSPGSWKNESIIDDICKSSCSKTGYRLGIFLILIVTIISHFLNYEVFSLFLEEYNGVQGHKLIPKVGSG